MSEPVDEAYAPDGRPRPHYAAVLDALAGEDLDALAADLRARAAAEEVIYGAGETAHPLDVDPVPRILTAEEWETVAAGVAQRARALEAFAQDALRTREAVAAGVIPADLLETSPHAVRELPAPPVAVGIAGLDLVRRPDGRLAVLEDNTRTPTLMAYALWARRAVRPRLPVGPEPRELETALRELLLGCLRAAAPDGDEPHAVILTDETTDSAWEVRELARLAGLPVATLDDLAHRRDRLVHAGRPVDVVYRRTPEDRLRDERGALTAVGEALLAPLRAGTLAVVNAFGSGVADDKRTFAHVEDLIAFHLGETPRLPSVRAFDLADARQRKEALERFDELVFKPRAGAGGHGVVLGARASADERRAVREAVDAEPDAWIAQELVVFSTHPTVVGGRLVPRHADLRPFAFAAPGGRYAVLPGAMTRFALAEGDLVVNAAQGGGAKDTWVLPTSTGIRKYARFRGSPITG